MLHKGTRSQHFGYIACATLSIFGKLAWRSCKAFSSFLGLILFHVLKF